MNKTLIAVSLLAALGTVASAETKLTTTTFTAGTGGFMVTSTLIAGDKEAILVDAQFSLAEAHRLIAQILESKKTLTTILITHSHPDHYFGLEAIKAAFPKAKIITSPESMAEITKTWAAKVKQWSPMAGALIPTKPVLPTAAKTDKLTLEGVTIEVHANVQGDSPDNTYVWIPSTKTLITGDIAYSGVHAWTAETNADARKKWEASLDTLIALAPTTVIAGHRDPKMKEDVSVLKATKDYLIAFDGVVASAKDAEDVKTKMRAKYKDLALDVVLGIGAEAQFAKPPAKK